MGQSPADLTFEAEDLGAMEHTLEVVEKLMAFLSHDSAVVREGAILGAARHMEGAFGGRLKARLHVMGASDPHPAVRELVSDILDS